MTLQLARACLAHRLVRRSMTLCAVLLVAATSLSAQALTVLLGTYTLQHDETHSSVTIGPLAAIDTNGHTLTINGNGGLSCLSLPLLLVGGHLYINSTQTGSGKVILSAAATHSIGAFGSVELMDSKACLEITTVNTTFSGLGRIIGRHPDATISIAADTRLTSQLVVIGALAIAGPGTFRNEYVLSAQGAYSANAKITLACDLSLEDNGSAIWHASAAELQFGHAQIDEANLAGDIIMDDGCLIKFTESVTTTGLLIWDDGTIEIPGSHTFQYGNYSPGAGSCANPCFCGPTGPFTISGPSYSRTCP